MEVDKERNRIALEQISYHLDEAMRFCSQLDLSGLNPIEQMGWDNRMKICKDTITFTRLFIEKLSQIL